MRSVADLPLALRRLAAPSDSERAHDGSGGFAFTCGPPHEGVKSPHFVTTAVLSRAVCRCGTLSAKQWSPDRYRGAGRLARRSVPLITTPVHTPVFKNSVTQLLPSQDQFFNSWQLVTRHGTVTPAGQTWKVNTGRLANTGLPLWMIIPGTGILPHPCLLSKPGLAGRGNIRLSLLMA
jgi:hypothetical protein